MNPVIDQLEERVSAVAALVKNLRAEVVRLERELAARPAVAPAPPAPQSALPQATPSPAAACDEDSLREELALLRAERELVRERISGLIREIDQVSW